MDNTVKIAVHEALELLKAGKKTEAHAMLVSIIKQNPDAAEAWYLLGFSVTDSDKSLYCFQQVLRIDPLNQVAQKQVDRLKAAKIVQPAIPEVEISPARPFIATPPPPVVTPKPVPPPNKKPLTKNPVFWIVIAVVVVGVLAASGAIALYMSSGMEISKKVDGLFVQRKCVEVMQYNSFGESFPRGMFSSYFSVYHQVEECQAQLALEQALKSQDWPASYTIIQNYLVSHPNGAFAADMLEQVGDVLLSWSNSLLAQNDYKTAIEKLELIQRGFPTSSIVPTAVITMFDDYLLWAKYFYDQKNYEEAERILKLVGSHAEASSGQVQQANQVLAAVYLAWGKAQIESGQFDEGVQHYEAARSLDPDLTDYNRLIDQVALLRVATLVNAADFDAALVMVKNVSETALSEESKVDALAEETKILDAYAHSDSAQAQAQMTTAATNMCKQETPTMPIFAKDAETIRFAFVSPYNLQIPDGWGAMRPAELHYVACIEQSQTVIQSCAYSGGRSARRNRYTWEVTLYDIATGEVHKTTKLQGTEPRRCAQAEVFYSNARVSDIYGTMPNVQQVLDWLNTLKIVE